MEAICKADFDKRVAAYLAAEEEKKRRKELAEQAEKEKRRRMKYQRPEKSGTTPSAELKEEETEKEVTIPQIGFHDIYGVWFFGRLKEVIVKTGREHFNTDLTKSMHVFVDVEPKKIPDGIHKCTVYGNECILYKWTAQTYHRGLVVLKDDEPGNQAAQVYMESQTWSWVLDNKNAE